jgi:hypothetical protein
MESEKNHQRQFILYCSLAGFTSAWAISGLLVVVEVISGTPAGTFLAVIGISLGFSDPVEAQYIGFLLHVITGATAGNIFGQLSLFWSKIAKCCWYGLMGSNVCTACHTWNTATPRLLYVLSTQPT